VPAAVWVEGNELPIERTLFNTSVLTQGGLGPLMVAASSQPAGRIGLFNTDRLLVEWAEGPSIKQARVARLASYNDYRRHCGLPPRASIEEISSDEDVAKRLARLYKRVEDVEFYVGLFAEDTLPNGVLPELMTAMVAYDAFSQVLTSPLLAPRIYNEQTFTRSGMQIIDETTSIADLVRRNVPGDSKDYFVSFSRATAS
jgi:prostaglandin-endoperoxide synthase 2